MAGYYRGVVEDVNDPQERGRARVRVHAVHDEHVPVENLPWAETIAFSGSGFGDVPHYEKGDRVAVMFEFGNCEYPAIIGGWIAAPSGLPDFPPEQQEEYSRTRRRWMRVDRKGNMIEMSELPDELYIRLKSGESEIIISQVDDSITLNASGPISINAETAQIVGKALDVRGEDVTVFANKRNALTGVGEGTLNLYTTQQVNLYAGNLPGIDPLAEIDIGQIRDAAAVLRQTKIATILSSDIRIGTPGSSDGSMLMLPTLQVIVEATTLVDLRAATVNLLGTLETKVKSAALVSVEAPVVDVKTASFAVHA
jgi:hypothetical protein